MATQKMVVGCAGEHFVAYRLSAMGYLVAMTRGGSPSVDLMVATHDGKSTVTVQVKTAKNAWLKSKRGEGNWYWHVGPKARTLTGPSVFYAFVDLKGGTGEGETGEPRKPDMPDVFIVPADYVAGPGNLETYPKNDPKPTDFWFDIPEHGERRWREAWHLINERLGPPQSDGAGP